MQAVKIKSYAKINLSLNVTGILDNLHTLDMVLASIDLADDILLIFNDGLKQNVAYSNKNIPVGNDSVSKALGLFTELYGDFGVDVFVKKNIPIASGLGGSGANAATVLNYLQKHFNTNFDLVEMAKKIGSDIVYQLTGGFARVEGVGDKITFFKPNPNLKLFAVIAMGNSGVESKDAYSAFDTIYPTKEKLVSDNDELIKRLTTKSTFDKTDFAFLANALTKPSIYLNNTIVDTLSSLYDAGSIHAIMSGSGGACVGFFNSKQETKVAVMGLKAKGLFAKAVSLS